MQKQSIDTQTALVVLGDRSIATNKLEKLQENTIRAIETIDTEENRNTIRRVFVGFSLHRIKASQRRGEFLKWIKRHVKGIGYQQCNFYMRIASVCVEKARVTKPELLALPGDQIDLPLESTADEARRFVEKVEKFVGGLSFNQLLEKYDIKTSKKIGGARSAKGNDSDEDEPIDPEQIAAQTREELSSALGALRYLLIEENVCQRLTKDDISSFESSLSALTKEWHAAMKKTLKSKKAA